MFAYWQESWRRTTYASILFLAFGVVPNAWATPILHTSSVTLSADLDAAGEQHMIVHDFGGGFAPGSIVAVSIALQFTDTGGAETFSVTFSDPISPPGFAIMNVGSSSIVAFDWLTSAFAALDDGTLVVTVELTSFLGPLSHAGATWIGSTLSVTTDDHAAATIIEPAPATLLGGGLLGLWLLGRRRFRLPAMR